MASQTSMPASTMIEHSEHQHHVVHTVQLTLRIIFGVVPIVAGLDKFTDLLANWNAYLNPMVLRIVPMTDTSFMHLVGIIEILAGVLVLTKPRLGAYIVMAWLIGIALQLIVWGRFLDIAVRDLVMALGGALTLARLTPLAERSSA
jgi:uncharacterized membrane protein YphA (DoxX/SURF4 family)